MISDIITPNNIGLFNENLRYEDPETIIKFALKIAEKPVVTTSFGAYSAAILFAITQVKKNVQVIWCDTGYNTEATHIHANKLIKQLDLHIEIFAPKYTTAFLNTTFGVPTIDNPLHPVFAEKVKLEPFGRALKEHQPDVWFTNLRRYQTSYRENMGILSFSKGGILKVSPFYYFSETEIQAYIQKHQLPIELDYYDPVKAFQNRECGIHLNN